MGTPAVDDIGALSASCLRCFDTLTRSLPTSSDDLNEMMPPRAIDNEYARFKIWAGNLGALQRGRSSLDARLRDSVVLRAAVLKFLGQLQDSLIKSAEITTGARLPYEQERATNLGSGGNDALDYEDIGNISDTSSEQDAGELAERLGEVKDVMEHLYRLSFKIRNTRYRSLTKKALLLKDEDPETGKDLFSAYAVFDRRHVQESLDHLRYRPSPKEFDTEPAHVLNHNIVDPLDTDDHLPDSDDFLLDRLSKAITNRRRYIAYWQRHALKLSHGTGESTFQGTVSPPTILVKPTELASRLETIVPTPDNLIPLGVPNTVVSGTDFSRYNSNLDDQLDAESVISYATTAFDLDGKSPEFPPPPPDAASKPEFVCPYCWVVCPSRQGKGKAWQEHIRQDLQPYVCTYEKCPDADHMYASRHAWLEHERLVHRRVWKCFEHRSFISKSKESLFQHFSDCHEGLSDQQIETFLDMAETTMADDRQKCPFCYSVGPFNKGFHNHIAFHQEQLGTFAAPRNLDSNDEVDSRQVQGFRSTGSMDSIFSLSNDGNRLVEAAISGNVALMERLLDIYEVDMNWQDSNGKTPLSHAAENGHEVIVQMLLDTGADVNAQGGEYGSALQAASVCGKKEIVQILLDAGADVNAQGGGTYGNALQAAAARGYQEIVQILLDAGADVNAQGGEYGNALQAAAARGYQEIVQILFDAGADVNTQGGEYGSALQAASVCGKKEIVQILLDTGADVNAQGGEYGNALQAAAARGYQEIVQILLDAGADVNAQGEYGNALDVALKNGHEEVAEILRNAGAKERQNKIQ